MKVVVEKEECGHVEYTETLGELREAVDAAMDEWTYEVVIRKRQGKKRMVNDRLGETPTEDRMPRT